MKIDELENENSSYDFVYNQTSEHDFLIHFLLTQNSVLRK